MSKDIEEVEAELETALGQNAALQLRAESAERLLAAERKAKAAVSTERDKLKARCAELDLQKAAADAEAKKAADLVAQVGAALQESQAKMKSAQAEIDSAKASAKPKTN